MHPAEIHTVLDELARATNAALTLARALAAAQGDEDGWARMPAPPARCTVSGWSRATLQRRITEGKVRAKLVNGSRFYSQADVRRLLALTPA
jgi:hypothetical protein